MTYRALPFALPLAMIAVAAPTVASAQFSDSTNFLKAVRDADGNKVDEIVKKSGASAAIINARDPSSRETALHIAARRRDSLYLNYLLQLKADPNVRDGTDATPLFVAAQLGWVEGVQSLIARRAEVDIAGPLGQTPLSRAVQDNNIALVRVLLAAGANANRQDTSGRSPRDLAASDPRRAAILKEIQDAKPAARREMQGPH